MLPCLLDRLPGESMLNPYDVQNLRDFNIFMICVGLISAVLNQMAWSGSQGFTVSAANAHEQKMGAVLGVWRGGFSSLMFILLAIASYAFLNDKQFENDANKVRGALAIKVVSDVAPNQAGDRAKVAIKDYADKFVTSPCADKIIASLGVKEARSRDNVFKVAKATLQAEDKAQAQEFGTIYNQMLALSAIKKILPVGLLGLFGVIIIFLMISCDTTQIHSWGSIIVQDVILPLRKKPFQPKQQLLLLRCMMVVVATMAFLFSALFRQVDYLMMFFAVTSAIWLGGAGSCIVFGLYWRRGTSWGAFAALFGGASIAGGGFICQSIWVNHLYPWLVKGNLLQPVETILEGISKPLNPYVVWIVEPGKFPINSQEIFFVAMLSSFSLYIIVSLLTCKKTFDLERMLHRGKYRKEGTTDIQRPTWHLKGIVGSMIGIDSQYSLGDKAIAYSVFIMSVVVGLGSWSIAFIWNLVAPWPMTWWVNWFYVFNIIIAGIVGVVSTIWFTICGTWDLRRLFERLKTKQTNVNDDGRVIDHVSTADISNKQNPINSK
jgi:Na+/proline symporter